MLPPAIPQDESAVVAPSPSVASQCPSSDGELSADTVIYSEGLAVRKYYRKKDGKFVKCEVVQDHPLVRRGPQAGEFRLILCRMYYRFISFECSHYPHSG